MKWWKRCILAIALAGVLLVVQYVAGVWSMPPHRLEYGTESGFLSRNMFFHEQMPPPPWWVDTEIHWCGSSTIAYGWPLPMVRCIARHGSGRWIVGFKGTALSSPSLGMPAGVPSDVLWRGLAGNLAFWFPPALVGVMGFLWARARFRRSRGRCTRCAYDMRGIGSVCPECGASAQGAGRKESPASSG